MNTHFSLEDTGWGFDAGGGTKDDGDAAAGGAARSGEDDGGWAASGTNGAGVGPAIAASASASRCTGKRSSCG